MRASAAFEAVNVGESLWPKVKRGDAARGQRVHRLPQQKIVRVMAAACIGGVVNVIGGAIAVGEKEHMPNLISAQKCCEGVGLLGGDPRKGSGEGGGPFP